MNSYPKWLREAASKGGKATGAAKRRGDSAHYKRLSRKAAKTRKAKSPNAGTERRMPPPQTPESTLTANGGSRSLQ